jgi:hypothetical protein
MPMTARNDPASDLALWMDNEIQVAGIRGCG